MQVFRQLVQFIAPNRRPLTRRPIGRGLLQNHQPQARNEPGHFFEPPVAVIARDHRLQQLKFFLAGAMKANSA